MQRCKRTRFEGVFKLFGTKPGWCKEKEALSFDDPEGTVIFSEIRSRRETLKMEPCEIDLTQEFRELRTPRKGQIISFLATLVALPDGSVRLERPSGFRTQAGVDVTTVIGGTARRTAGLTRMLPSE